MILKKTIQRDSIKPLFDMIGKYDRSNPRLVFAGLHSENAGPEFCNATLYVDEVGRDASHARIRQPDGTYEAFPILDAAVTTVASLLSNGWKFVPEKPE